MPTIATARDREPLAANPGLADLGVTLPAGTVVAIPDPAPAAATIDLVQLWD